MYQLWFLLSIILIILGHTVKSLRQKQLSDFYEDVSLSVFNEALAAGYLVNLILPFRLGDILRAFLAGRKMKNGFSFAFATVLVDRILDVIVVGLIYLGLTLFAPDLAYDSGSSAFLYMLLSLVAVVLIVLVTFAKRFVKKVIRFFTGIFNERIELSLMFFFWSVITAFRDIAVKISKKKLLLLTSLMWVLYVLSYYLLSLFFASYASSGIPADTVSREMSLGTIFSYLFASSSIDRSMLAVGGTDRMMLAYLSISALLLFLTGLAGSLKRGTVSPEKTMMLLPQVHENDRRNFLEYYFEGDRSTYVRGYLDANSDIQIISDRSAGSDATTLLAIKDGRTIYRKYVVGEAAAKLISQIEWLERYGDILPLPKIMDKRSSEGMTLYDMPAVTGATGFFEYIHTNPPESSERILLSVCSDLQDRLYGSAAKEADSEAVDRYIDEKVMKNISLLEGSRIFSDLLSHRTLEINGRTVRGFYHVKEIMERERLREIFSHDIISPIHGDVTVENIIAVPESSDYPGGYYLIDPNCGNILDSRFIDMAKILQSLHGGYEFLSGCDRVKVSGNSIRYISEVSRSYRDLYGRFMDYLRKEYTEEQIRSIRHHEVINWLRLMPYRIRHDENRAAVFLAALVLTADEID